VRKLIPLGSFGIGEFKTSGGSGDRGRLVGRNQAGKDQGEVAGRGLLLRKQRGEKGSGQIERIKLTAGSGIGEPLIVAGKPGVWRVRAD
jgi:hypothetical protein